MNAFMPEYSRVVGELEIEWLVVSPFGTTQAVCTECRKVFPAAAPGQRESQYRVGRHLARVAEEVGIDVSEFKVTPADPDP